jgi:hypothetical protein
VLADLAASQHGVVSLAQLRAVGLAADGYLVIRLTWQRITQEAAAVRAELQRILAIRAGTVAAR